MVSDVYYAGSVHTLHQVSVLGTGTSTEFDFKVQEAERLSVTECNEEEPPPPVSVTRILKKNMPEWPQILVGSLASIVVSSTVPIFVVLFGDILKVSSLN
jgi:hypothetical protein